MIKLFLLDLYEKIKKKKFIKIEKEIKKMKLSISSEKNLNS